MGYIAFFNLTIFQIIAAFLSLNKIEIFFSAPALLLLLPLSERRLLQRRHRQLRMLLPRRLGRGSLWEHCWRLRGRHMSCKLPLHEWCGWQRVCLWRGLPRWMIFKKKKKKLDSLLWKSLYEYIKWYCFDGICVFWRCISKIITKIYWMLLLRLFSFFRQFFFGPKRI